MKTSASLFLQRYEKDIAGVLGCYDRMVMTGTLLDVSYPAAVQSLLAERGLRCFEIGEFAEPLREAVRENAQAVAAAAGLKIEYLGRQRRAKGRSDRGHPAAAWRSARIGAHFFGDGELPLLQAVAGQGERSDEAAGDGGPLSALLLLCAG